MIAPFDACKDVFTGRSVLLVGNGPSATKLGKFAKSYDRIATVNAGAFILSQERLNADLLWIQDGRMLVMKRDKVIPYLSPEIGLCLPKHVALPAKYQPRYVLRFEHLGNKGFSRDPRIGIFSGYNALYGLIQLLAWCRPQKVGIIGMDLDYGRNNPRSYQSKRGFDVDLHVNDSQIMHSLAAVAELRATGIDVEIHEPSAVVSRAIIPS